MILRGAGPAPVHAQTISFGKNKIHYNEFQWRVLASPHFDLYYYPEEDSLARMALAMAEESYQALAARWGYHVNRRIPLIIYASHQDFEQTNVSPYVLPEGVAGFTEFIKGRVTIPFDGSMSDFKHTIQHELVHVFQLAREESVYGRHYRTQPLGPPFWMSEGQADHWSEEWDGTAEMVLRDLVLSNQLPAVGDLWRYDGSFINYKVGQDLCGFIEREFGRDAIPRVYENLWKSRDFDAALTAAVGVGERELSERWHRELKLRFYPGIESATPPSLVARPLATRGGANFKPFVVPASAGVGTDRYVFVSPRTGYAAIYMASMNGEESELRTIVRGERSAEFESLHPFRSKIDVSPAGRLAMAAKFHERDALFFIDLRTGREIDRFQFEDLIGILSPSQSRDGTVVAFSGLARDGHSDLYLFYPSDRRLERITHDWYQDLDPALSPDGRWVAFSSDRTPDGFRGTRNLFLYDRTTGEIRALTRGSQVDGAPAWSNHGDRLAFVSDRRGTPQLYVTDLAGQGGRITGLQGGAFDPSWLEDDSGLLFSAYHQLRYRIYRLNEIAVLDGTEDLAAAASADLAANAATPGAEVGSPPLLPAAAGRALPPAPLDSLGSSRLMALGNRARAGEPWHWEPRNPPPTRPVTYDPHYTFDFAQGGVAFDPGLGSGEGLQALLSDQLGDRLIFFQLSNTAETTGDLLSRFNVSVTRYNLNRRFNRGIGLYHFAGDFLDERDVRYFERRAGLQLVGSYPFSKFRRLESSLFLYHSERSDDSFRPGRVATLASNYLSFIHDNSLWLATGPIDGSRYNLSVGVTTDLGRASVENVSLIADWRYYLRLAQRTALATRVQVRIAQGTNEDRFVLGGSYSLRGFPRRSLFGTRSLLVNNELRFPLLEGAVLGFPFGNIGLPGVQGALFGDVGNAWDEGEGAFPTPYGSFGLGLRSSLGGFLVLRLDFSRTTDFVKLSRSTDTDFFIGFNY